MKNRERIVEYFDCLPDGSVVIASDLYEKEFLNMSQDAFFRLMERLSDNKEIYRITKGMYIKISDCEKNLEEILLNYYFGEDNDSGLFIGYELYRKYSLTLSKAEVKELYSNNIRSNTSRVLNLYVKKPAVKLSFENAKVIEALEIMQNYYDIEGLNKQKFASYVRQFARYYNDEAACLVISSMKYKKSTIAFMKKCLDMYKVDNTLQQFLSYASDYKVPTVLRLRR